ncbi:unnamed protein product [Rangifer tarandus platyrhynchus]|uniref:Uncharacterized protein n=1 Tax=Rangifer tarandus platyrhynchus TaxID=3082113 RepID=A0AC59ZWA7_RANTA
MGLGWRPRLVLGGLTELRGGGGDGQETSRCSGPLAWHAGSSLGETCVEAEVSPVRMCPEASMPPALGFQRVPGLLATGCL